MLRLKDSRLIDFVRPVDLTHPLVKGMKGWWMGLPGAQTVPFATAGGEAHGFSWFYEGLNKVRDLLTFGDPHGNHGVMTDIAAAWESLYWTQGRNGFPSVYHSKIASFPIQGSTVAAVNGTYRQAFTAPPITMACVVKWDSYAAYHGIMGQPTNAKGMLISGGAESNLAYIWAGSAGDYDWVSGVTVSVGQWYYVALEVYPDTRARVYACVLDGGPLQMAERDEVFAHGEGTDTISAFQLGSERAELVSRGFSGLMESAWVWNRCLGYQQHELMVRQARTMYKDMLRTWSPHTTAAYSAAAGEMKLPVPMTGGMAVMAGGLV